MRTYSSEQVHPAFTVKLGLYGEYEGYDAPFAKEFCYEPGRVTRLDRVHAEADEMMAMGYVGDDLDRNGNYLILTLDDGQKATFRDGYTHFSIYDPNEWLDGGRIPKREGGYYVRG